MYSVMYLTKRRPDLSQQEFERYQHEVHVPITLRHSLLRGYRVGIVRAAKDGSTPPFDGYAILSYDSREDYEADELSAESDVSNEDVKNFLADVYGMFVEETVYLGPEN